MEEEVLSLSLLSLLFVLASPISRTFWLTPVLLVRPQRNLEIAHLVTTSVHPAWNPQISLTNARALVLSVFQVCYLDLSGLNKCILFKNGTLKSCCVIVACLIKWRRYHKHPITQSWPLKLLYFSAKARTLHAGWVFGLFVGWGKRIRD